MQSPTEMPTSETVAQQEREHGAAEQMSETDFLAEQANAAKEAVARTAQELIGKLGQNADPRELAKQHPWMSIAAAAVSGFAAAAIAVPSKEQQAMRRLSRLERTLNMHRDQEHDEEDRGARQYASGRSSFWGGMAQQVLEAVKPALLSALTAGIAAKTAKPDAEDFQPQSPQAGKQSGHSASPGTSPGNGTTPGI